MGFTDTGALDATRWSRAMVHRYPGSRVRPAPTFARGRMRSTCVGPIGLHDAESGPQELLHRPPPGTPAYVSVLVQLEGEARVGRGRSSCWLRPGQLALVDTRYDLALLADRRYRQLFALFPLALTRPLPDPLVLPRLDSGSPQVQRLFDGLCEARAHADPRASARADPSPKAHALLTLLRQVQALPARDRSRAAVRVERALRFIDQELGDPTLSAAAVAAAQGVSRRFLDGLFRESGTTIQATIWTRRLEHAARQLRAPQCRAWSVAAIAQACGFRTASHFSRSFRDRYGQSPSRYRAQLAGQLTNAR